MQFDLGITLFLLVGIAAVVAARYFANEVRSDGFFQVLSNMAYVLPTLALYLVSVVSLSVAVISMLRIEMIFHGAIVFIATSVIVWLLIAVRRLQSPFQF